ncbi:MAG: presqualene diphosphate synthase HpnD [Candidatus Polarisedimenticolia bacterium]
MSAAITDQALASRIARRSGSNFYYAFLFLPRPQRKAIEALYAFCREVDDSVDAAPDPAEAARRIDAWRRELDACYAGRATHPITRTLAEHLGPYPIRRQDLEDVIEGVSMDIVPRRYDTWADLQVYCDRVASAVGLACLEIFGCPGPTERAYAIALGQAFQLTNIVRDVKPDALRGRIYIPMEDLAACRCPEADLTADRPSPAFTRLMEKECGRARALFAQASRLLEGTDRRALMAAEIMGAIYERLLGAIEARGHDVLGSRVSLSRARRMAIAARVYLRRRALSR